MGKDSSRRTCSREKASLRSKTVACTKATSERERKKAKARWSSQTEISTSVNGKMMCSTALVCTIQRKRESKSKVTTLMESAQLGSANPSKWAVPPTED